MVDQRGIAYSPNRLVLSSQQDRSIFNQLHSLNSQSFKQRRLTRGPKPPNSISPSKLRHLNEESQCS